MYNVAGTHKWSLKRWYFRIWNYKMSGRDIIFWNGVDNVINRLTEILVDVPWPIFSWL